MRTTAIRCDVLVVGSGLAALAAGRRLRDAGRSVVFVELASERPVRAMFAVDPTPLAAAGCSGRELDARFFHAPVPRLFALASEVRLEVDAAGVAWRDGDTHVSAAALLFAPAPGDVAMPDFAHALAGRGVSTCAWSDAAFFGDPIVVVGDGDFAFESALFAAERSRDVIVLSEGVPRVSRASLRSLVAASPRILIERGVHLAGIVACGERLSLSLRAIDDGHDGALDVGGVIIAGEPRHAPEVRTLMASVAGARVYRVAGSSEDENDHAGRVAAGVAAADEILNR